MLNELDLCKAPDCNKPKDKKRGSAWCMMHRSRRSRHKSIELPEKPKLPDGILKICKIHGELTKKDAYKVPRKPGWYQCKICKQIRLKQYEQRNPNRDSNRNRNYLFIGKERKIRVPIKRYEELHKLQDGKCKICNNPEDKLSSAANRVKRLAIDHCHKTGIIRGLLCQTCNIGLGAFNDSIEKMESAIAYLEKHK